MCETSKRPTPVRTAMCSAIRPPPGPGYSTGISHPPKSTIFALRARCVALRAVFFKGVEAAASCAGETGVDMGTFLSGLFLLHDRLERRRGQTGPSRTGMPEAQ